jgi:hypothetical protein
MLGSAVQTDQLGKHRRAPLNGNTNHGDLLSHAPTLHQTPGLDDEPDRARSVRAPDPAHTSDQSSPIRTYSRSPHDCSRGQGAAQRSRSSTKDRDRRNDPWSKVQNW